MQLEGKHGLMSDETLTCAQGVIDPSLDVPSIVPPSIAATTSQPPGSYATGQTGERAEPCFVPARDDGNRAAGKDGNRDGAEERQALSGQAESGKRVQSVASKGQPKLGSEGTAARSDAAALSDAAAFYRSLLDGFTQDESHADTAQVSGYWASSSHCFTLCLCDCGSSWLVCVCDCGSSCLVCEPIGRGLKG